MRPVRGPAALVACLALAGSAAAAPPVVDRVEPPSWWAGHSVNPVRLLLHGRNLAGVKLEPAAGAAGAGLAAGAVRVSGSGTWLFVDVTIDPQAAPGPRRLRVATPQGSAMAPFDIVPRLAPEGRFQGVSRDDVIYMVLPDRFANGDPGNDDPPLSRGLHDRSRPRFYHGGDLAGLREHLAYLADLGVTALWIAPVYDNSNRINERERYDGQGVADYHGYGAVDFYGVEEHFGDMASLRSLVDAAHRLGLKVVQDQVANHTGPCHPWVLDPPTPTWFHGSEADHEKNAWQIWTLLDPHATPQLRESTLDGWFIDILPDLDQEDPEVARYLVQNSLWWVGMAGFDGIRQDTLPYVPRRYWAEWRMALRREFPRLTVVGEAWDGDPALVSFFQGGVARDGVDTGIEALFDFPLFYPLRQAFAQGKPLRDVARMLAHDRLYPDADALVTFLGLHDVPRFMSEPGASVAGLELAFTYLLTARGVPLVYYGDEIAMRGGDAENRRDFPGGWPEDPRSAFEASGRTPEQQEVFEHVRRLARLRAERAALRRGATLDLAVGEQTYAFARVAGDDRALVVLNNGIEPATIECGVGPAGLADGTRLEDRLGAGPELEVAGGRIRTALRPRSAAVYVPKAAPR